MLYGFRPIFYGRLGIKKKRAARQSHAALKESDIISEEMKL